MPQNLIRCWKNDSRRLREVSIKELKHCDHGIKVSGYTKFWDYAVLKIRVRYGAGRVFTHQAPPLHRAGGGYFWGDPRPAPVRGPAQYCTLQLQPPSPIETSHAHRFLNVENILFLSVRHESNETVFTWSRLLNSAPLVKIMHATVFGFFSNYSPSG